MCANVTSMLAKLTFAIIEIIDDLTLEIEFSFPFNFVEWKVLNRKMTENEIEIRSFYTSVLFGARVCVCHILSIMFMTNTWHMESKRNIGPSISKLLCLENLACARRCEREWKKMQSIDVFSSRWVPYCIFRN